MSDRRNSISFHERALHKIRGRRNCGLILRRSEYALRFAFGGAITVAAGLIANKRGPGVGSLFLAFPAISQPVRPQIEKHEKQKKLQHGLDGTIRGREAAGLDAAGAPIGSIGLIAFSVAVWRLMPFLSTWLVMICATLAWLITSVVIWYLRKTRGGLTGRRKRHRPEHPIENR
jgi:hypothetical protein